MAFWKKRAKRSQTSSHHSVGRKKSRTLAFAIKTPECGQRFTRHHGVCMAMAHALPQSGCVQEYGNPFMEVWYPMEMAIATKRKGSMPQEGFQYKARLNLTISSLGRQHIDFFWINLFLINLIQNIGCILF